MQTVSYTYQRWCPAESPVRVEFRAELLREMCVCEGDTSPRFLFGIRRNSGDEDSAAGSDIRIDAAHSSSQPDRAGLEGLELVGVCLRRVGGGVSLTASDRKRLRKHRTPLALVISGEWAGFFVREGARGFGSRCYEPFCLTDAAGPDAAAPAVVEPEAVEPEAVEPEAAEPEAAVGLNAAATAAGAPGQQVYALHRAISQRHSLSQQQNRTQPNAARRPTVTAPRSPDRTPAREPEVAPAMTRMTGGTSPALDPSTTLPARAPSRGLRAKVFAGGLQPASIAARFGAPRMQPPTRAAEVSGSRVARPSAGSLVRGRFRERARVAHPIESSTASAVPPTRQRGPAGPTTSRRPFPTAAEDIARRDSEHTKPRWIRILRSFGGLQLGGLQRFRLQALKAWAGAATAALVKLGQPRTAQPAATGGSTENRITVSLPPSLTEGLGNLLRGIREAVPAPGGNVATSASVSTGRLASLTSILRGQQARVSLTLAVCLVVVPIGAVGVLSPLIPERPLNLSVHQERGQLLIEWEPTAEEGLLEVLERGQKTVLPVTAGAASATLVYRGGEVGVRLTVGDRDAETRFNGPLFVTSASQRDEELETLRDQMDALQLEAEQLRRSIDRRKSRVEDLMRQADGLADR